MDHPNEPTDSESWHRPRSPQAHDLTNPGISNPPPATAWTGAGVPSRPSSPSGAGDGGGSKGCHIVFHQPIAHAAQARNVHAAVREFQFSQIGWLRLAALQRIQRVERLLMAARQDGEAGIRRDAEGQFAQAEMVEIQRAPPRWKLTATRYGASGADPCPAGAPEPRWRRCATIPRP